jgi:hypothetical protein
MSTPPTRLHSPETLWAAEGVDRPSVPMRSTRFPGAPTTNISAQIRHILRIRLYRERLTA